MLANVKVSYWPPSPIICSLTHCMTVSMIQAALLCKRATSKDVDAVNWGHNIPLLLKLAILVPCFSEYFSVSCVYWLFGYFGLVHPGRTGSGYSSLVHGCEQCAGMPWCRSGPPRRWPAVPLSCPSCLWTKPTRREGNVGPGAGSTAVTLLHIIWARSHIDGDIFD